LIAAGRGPIVGAPRLRPILEDTMPTIKTFVKFGLIAILAVIVAKRLPITRDYL